MKLNVDLRDNTVKLLYKLLDNLLYFDNLKRDMRLYISTVLKYEIFKLTYNKIRYLEYTRIYEKLIYNVYIFSLFS